MSTLNGYSGIAASPYDDSLPDQLQYLSPEEFPEHLPEQTIERHFIDKESLLDNRMGPESLQDYTYELEQRLVDSLERFAQEYQEDDELAEILPALVPIIAAVAPSVIQAVAPAVVQGVSSLISNVNKRRAPQRQPPPSAARRTIPPPQQRPQTGPTARRSYRPVQRTVSPQRPISNVASTLGRVAGTVASALASTPPTTAPAGTTGPVGGAPSGLPAGGTAATGTTAPLNQLVSLLTNPGIISLIQQAAGSLSPGAETISVGREQIEVSVGSLLNAIAQYAQMGAEQLLDENRTEIPEYLLDAEGNFLCDVSSPRERAEVLLNLLQEEETAD